MAQNLGGEGSDGAVTWDSDGQGEKCHTLPHISSLQYRGEENLYPSLIHPIYLEAAGRQAPPSFTEFTAAGAPQREVASAAGGLVSAAHSCFGSRVRKKGSLAWSLWVHHKTSLEMLQESGWNLSYFRGK